METLSDIVAQMRGRGEDGRMDRRLWLDYADRIEAIDSADAWRSLYTPGNAAAMREALDELVANIEMRASVFGIFSIIDRKTFLDAKAALSEPARNCDRFADETDAQIAFLNEVWLISVTKETMLEQDKIENWTDEMRIAYAKWLLAPAAERKGDGDGR